MSDLTILAQLQEISARTGIPVADLMEARERAAELLLDVVAEEIDRIGLDFEIAEAVTRVRLTSKQKADAALAVPCPVHDVPAGEPCTSPKGAFAGSCLDRREAALGMAEPGHYQDRQAAL
jgi:hypothetical protein